MFSCQGHEGIGNGLEGMEKCCIFISDFFKCVVLSVVG